MEDKGRYYKLITPKSEAANIIYFVLYIKLIFTLSMKIFILSINLSIYVLQFNFTNLVRRALVTTENEVETEGKRCEVVFLSSHS